jgi:hypothetical protein
MIKESKFRNTRVPLDGQEFVDCTFHDCTLIYSGGIPPSLKGCDLGNSKLEFADAAKRTVEFLRAMASPTSGLQTVIRQLFVFPTTH